MGAFSKVYIHTLLQIMCYIIVVVEGFLFLPHVWYLSPLFFKTILNYLNLTVGS